MLAELLNNTRNISPMVHYMVNPVLASVASPIMAEDADEAEEVTSVCDGLVLNLGTPNPRKIEALLRAVRAANSLRHLCAHD